MALNHSHIYCLTIVFSQKRDELLYFRSFSSKLPQETSSVEKLFESLWKQSTSSAPFRMGKFSVRVQGEKLGKRF